MRVLFLAAPLSFTKKDVYPRHPPHYTAYAAACLEVAGHQVAIIDAFLEHLDLEMILRRIQAAAPELVMVIPFDYTRETPMAISHEIAKALRTHFSQMRIGLAGTANQQLFAESMKTNTAFEFAIQGEYEQTLVRLIESNFEDLDQIPGLFLRSEQGLVNTGPAALVSDLDELPFPAWHLLDFKSYVAGPHRYKYTPFYPLLASRGCPFPCRFCQEMDNTKMGKYRLRSVAWVIAEIRHALEHFSAKEIQFADPTFGINKRWVRQFCDALEQENLKIPWSILSRVDVMDRETLHRMAKAGCWNVLYGVETASPRIQQTIKKNLSLDRVLACVNETREAGLQSTLSYIFGHPGETPGDVLETIQFSIKVNSDYAQYFLFKYYAPDAELDQLGTATTDWDMVSHDFQGPIYVPQAFQSSEELKRLQKLAYRRFYWRPQFILRHLPELLNPLQWLRFLRGFWVLQKI